MEKTMINPSDHGVNTMLASDFKVDAETVKGPLIAVMKAINERPPLVKELSIYRKNVPKILDYLFGIEKLNKVLTTTFERYETDSEDKKYKRWTDEEDLMLIEKACSDISMLELSTAMGRSPSSIKTRLSKLVGIKRISQEVAGRFIGNIDGTFSECAIDGTIYKET